MRVGLWVTEPLGDPNVHFAGETASVSYVSNDAEKSGH